MSTRVCNASRHTRNMINAIVPQKKSQVEEAWESADDPDYVNNVNLQYPYSELPYFGDYYLIKLPTDGLIPLVDYWGEGLVEYLNEKKGYPDSYNVNEQFALVTKGTYGGRKIPNRIPVVSTTECDTSSYIEDDKVHRLTVSTKPILKQCAADIARMINAAQGLVIAYEYTDASESVKNLAKALAKKDLYYGAGFTVPFSELEAQTMFTSRRVFVNGELIKEHLYNSVTGGDYINAVKTIRSLVDNGGETVCRQIIDKLVSQGVRNTMSFAYKLWADGHQDIVKNYFPSEFRLIVGQEEVKIIGKYFDQAIFLDSVADEYNDRLTWGEKSEKTGPRVSWKFIPIWEGNTVFFKIMNMEYHMYLKLNVNTDEYGYGDRSVWGSVDSGEKRHTWYLYPVKVDNVLLFLIENREYRQGLKLNSQVDSGGYGDRQVWGHNGNVADAPGYYGFLIESWK